MKQYYISSWLLASITLSLTSASFHNDNNHYIMRRQISENSIKRKNNNNKNDSATQAGSIRYTKKKRKEESNNRDSQKMQRLDKDGATTSFGKNKYKAIARGDDLSEAEEASHIGRNTDLSTVASIIINQPQVPAISTKVSTPPVSAPSNFPTIYSKEELMQQQRTQSSFSNSTKSPELIISKKKSNKYYHDTNGDLQQDDSSDSFESDPSPSPPSDVINDEEKYPYSSSRSKVSSKSKSGKGMKSAKKKKSSKKNKNIFSKKKRSASRSSKYATMPPSQNSTPKPSASVVAEDTTLRPSLQPTIKPTLQPTTGKPTLQPTTGKPASTSMPTKIPVQITSSPTYVPSTKPVVDTEAPVKATAPPTTLKPSTEPTKRPTTGTPITKAPTAGPTVAAGSPTTFPTKGLPYQILELPQYYVAYNATIINDIPPTSEQYQEVLGLTDEYLNAYFERWYAMEFDVKFERVETSLGQTLYKADIPDSQYNIYVEYKTDFIYTLQSRLPGEDETFNVMKEALESSTYYTDYVWKAKDSPFAYTNNVVMDKISNLKNTTRS